MTPHFLVILKKNFTFSQIFISRSENRAFFFHNGQNHELRKQSSSILVLKFWRSRLICLSPHSRLRRPLPRPPRAPSSPSLPPMTQTKLLLLARYSTLTQKASSRIFLYHLFPNSRINLLREGTPAVG